MCDAAPFPNQSVVTQVEQKHNEHSLLAGVLYCLAALTQCPSLSSTSICDLSLPELTEVFFRNLAMRCQPVRVQIRPVVVGNTCYVLTN